MDPSCHRENMMIDKNIAMARNIAITASILLCLTGLLSCRTQSHLVIHQTDTLTITVRELPATYPLIAPFRYSHVIEPGNTLALLESLTYETGSLVPFSRGPRHQVFTRNQAESLAPELSKALNLALPHEVATFRVSGAKQSRRYTKGLAFVHGDELHLIIEELQLAGHEGAQQVSRWSLLPGAGQHHYTSQQGDTGPMTNWIVAPLR